MKDSRNIRRGAFVGTLVTLTLLTGCTFDSSSDEDSTDKASSQASANTEPSVAPAQVGEVLPAEPEALADGANAYAMGDGSYVVVAEDQPLPQNVVDDANAQLPTKLADKTSSFRVAADAANAYASQIESGTGKTVVVIYPVMASCTAGGEDMVGYTFTTFAGVASKDFGCGLAASVDEAQARVAQGIASQVNPDDFIVLAYAG